MVALIFQPVFIHILSVMLHPSGVASVTGALGGPAVYLAGVVFVLCEVEVDRILCFVLGDSWSEVEFLLDVLVLRLALVKWVVLVNVVVKGVLAGVKVLLVNSVG